MTAAQVATFIDTQINDADLEDREQMKFSLEFIQRFAVDDSWEAFKIALRKAEEILKHINRFEESCGGYENAMALLEEHGEELEAELKRSGDL